MWSIKQLEEIRDDCLEDIIAVLPDMEGQLKNQRIEINHRTVNMLARFAMNYIEISAYLLSSTTTRTFLQTLIMKGVIKGQLHLQEYDLAFEQIVTALQKNNPDKYDFKEYKDFTKHNVEVPHKTSSYKYAVHCPKCGEIFRFKKICKTVVSPQEYICTKCKVSLERL